MTKTPEEKQALAKEAQKRATKKWKAKTEADPVALAAWKKKKHEYYKRWKAKLTLEELKTLNEYHKRKSKEWHSQRAGKSTEYSRIWVAKNPEKAKEKQTRARKLRNARNKKHPLPYIAVTNRGLKMKETPKEIAETITLIANLKRITKKTK